MYRTEYYSVRYIIYCSTHNLSSAVFFFFVKWTDGDYFLDSYLVIWWRLLVACSLRSHEKHLKIFHALRAPCFVSKFSEKTPICGFWSDDTRIKKLFLLFFLLPCPCWRAQRAEIFVFSLGFFFWNGLRTKLEAFESPQKSSISYLVDLSCFISTI